MRQQIAFYLCSAAIALCTTMAGCPPGATIGEPNSTISPGPSDPGGPVDSADGTVATRGKVMVEVVNPTKRDATARVRMDLLGQRVRFSQRDVTSGGTSAIVGPDEADTVVIDAEFDGTPAASAPTAEFRFGREFSDGALVRYVLPEPPADPNDGSGRPPPTDDEPNTPPEPNTPDDPNDGLGEPPPPPPPLSLSLSGFESYAKVRAGAVLPFTLNADGFAQGATVRVFVAPQVDGELGSATDLLNADADDALAGAWDTTGFAPGDYLVFAEIADGARFLRIGTNEVAVTILGLPELSFTDPAADLSARRGSVLSAAFIWSAAEGVSIRILLDPDESLNDNEVEVGALPGAEAVGAGQVAIDTAALDQPSYRFVGIISDGLPPQVASVGARLCLADRLIGPRDLAQLEEGAATTIAAHSMGGATAHHQLGAALDIRGDLDGDGVADVLIGDPAADVWIGKSYVYRAGAVAYHTQSAGTPWMREMDVGVLRGTLLGSIENGQLGASVAWGDAFYLSTNVDVLVGEPDRATYDTFDGQAAFVRGPVLANHPGAIVLDDVSPPFVQRLAGDLGSGERAGAVVASLRDANGDCLVDLAVGAPDYDGGRGRVAVLYRPSILGRDATMGDVGKTVSGLLWLGAAAGDRFGAAIADAWSGSLSKDPTCSSSGVLVGAPGANAAAGAAYFHRIAAPVARDLPHAAWSTLSLLGENPGDQAGAAVAALDYDGDRLADLVVGAPGFGAGAGRVYVILGGGLANFEGDTLPLSAIADGAVAGLVFDGASAGDQFGFAVASAGDLDQDGYSELIVGAPGANEDRGAATVVYGGQSAAGVVRVDSIGVACGLEGWTIEDEQAAAGARLGAAVAGGGDLNADGVADLAVGAPGSLNPQIDGVAHLLFSEPISR